MIRNFNLENFISQYITERNESLFAKDIFNNKEKLHQEINNKKVLVIGAAGTIGASFTKNLLIYNPSKLVIVDVNENGLTEFVRDCRSQNNLTLPADFKSYPMSFSSAVFYNMLSAEGPFDIVANFAAHKHVRSEKDLFSIQAMVENNVINAYTFLEYLNTNKPSHFFCVSTDKAANPVNIMGASKKLMEDMILAYSTEFKVTTARFANVAFSNGSLPDGWIQRIFKKQPISCPSDVTRFFVSPKEAGEICLLACILGNTGDIYFPKLSPEKDLKNFKDICISFLKVLGYETDLCNSDQEARDKAVLLNENSTQYPVFFFESDTSGEKLYEEFYTDNEDIDLEHYQSLGFIKNISLKPLEDIKRINEKIIQIFKNASSKTMIVDLLKELLPNFEHIETGKNLDQKM